MTAALIGCDASTEAQLGEVRAMQDVGEFAESIEPLSEIVAREPGNAEANYLLGAAFVRTRQSNSAIWRLGRAAESEKSAVSANMGFVHLKRGETKAAVAALRRALAIDPKAASVRYRLGLALAQSGDAQGAHVAFEQALVTGAFPEREEARRELARLDQRVAP